MQVLILPQPLTGLPLVAPVNDVVFTTVVYVMAMLVLLALRDEDYISTDVLRIAVVLNASVYSTAYAIYALSIGITQNPIPLTYALSYTRIYPGLLTIPFLPTLRHIAKHMGCSIAENRGAAK